MSALRDYQHAAIQQIYREWQRGKRRVLLAMPTGSGKTRTFSEIARHALAKGDRVLVVAHREELLLQSQATLERITGVGVGFIKAGYPLDLAHPVQCASVQTLARRLDRDTLDLQRFGLAIVDEAHLSLANSYLKILQRLPQSRVLGVTATPSRLDGCGFDRVYEALVLGPSVSELIQRGFLADYDILAPESFLPEEGDGIRITGGDFNVGDLAARIDRRYVAGQAVEAYLKHSRGKRCVVFAINVEHSQAIAERYRQAGIAAEHLDGETPLKERQAILQRFRSGRTQVLCNVQLFTEGFDLPELEVVQLCRPTQSVALHLQMVGRALRPQRGKRALILDHAGNCLRLGGPKAERHWTLQGVAAAPAPLLPPPRLPEVALPPLPPRRVEILETVSALQRLPGDRDLETQLAQAAYQTPRGLPRSPSSDPNFTGARANRPPRSPSPARPRPPRPATPMQRVGRAALELASLLDRILDWIRTVWGVSPQRQPVRRRRSS